MTGRLTGLDNDTGVTFHFHPDAPHIGFPGDDLMWKAWSAVGESPIGPNFFRAGLGVAADGSFEISNMLPGSYQIFFTRGGEKQHLASGKFRVPTEQRDDNPEPMDAGEFKAR